MVRISDVSEIVMMFVEFGLEKSLLACIKTVVVIEVRAFLSVWHPICSCFIMFSFQNMDANPIRDFFQGLTNAVLFLTDRNAILGKMSTASYQEHLQLKFLGSIVTDLLIDLVELRVPAILLACLDLLLWFANHYSL